MATNLVLEKIKLHLYIVYTLKSTSYRPANCCHQSNLSEPNKYFWPKVGIWPKYYYDRSIPQAKMCITETFMCTYGKQGLIIVGQYVEILAIVVQCQ